jgi:hypothetical protein
MATAYIDSPKSANNSKVFKVNFAAGTQLHGAIENFIFSNTTSYEQANNKTIAHIMTDYWLSFVRTRDPNIMRNAGAPFWRSYSASPVSATNAPAYAGPNADVGFNVLEVTYNSMEAIRDPDAGPKCDFFSSRGWVLRN